MPKLMKIAFACLAAVTLTTAVSAPAIAAATTKATPAKTMASAPVTAGLYCQIGKSGANITVQAVNKTKEPVKAGTLFAYTLIGPKHSMRESYKLQYDIGPNEWVNVTKPMPAAQVTSCKPSA